MQKELLERPPYIRNAIIALVLTIIIFSGIFYGGYLVSYNKYLGVLESQEQLRYNLLSFEVERNFLENNCSSFNPYLFSEEMDNMGKVIDILEKRLGKNDKSLIEQKKIYSLLEARHFLYIQEHNKLCPNKVNTIFFFYSNSEQSLAKSEKLGIMLSSLKNSEENLLIYSFDYDLDSSLIELIKEKYKVNSPVTIVINEKNYLNVFDNVDSIKSLLKN